MISFFRKIDTPPPRLHRRASCHNQMKNAWRCAWSYLRHVSDIPITLNLCHISSKNIINSDRIPGRLRISWRIIENSFMVPFVLRSLLKTFTNITIEYFKIFDIYNWNNENPDCIWFGRVGIIRFKWIKSLFDNSVGEKWASCQIRTIAGCAYAGNAGNVFSAILG